MNPELKKFLIKPFAFALVGLAAFLYVSLITIYLLPDVQIRGYIVLQFIEALVDFHGIFLVPLIILLLLVVNWINQQFEIKFDGISRKYSLLIQYVCDALVFSMVIASAALLSLAITVSKAQGELMIASAQIKEQEDDLLELDVAEIKTSLKNNDFTVEIGSDQFEGELIEAEISSKAARSPFFLKNIVPKHDFQTPFADTPYFLYESRLILNRDTDKAFSDIANEIARNILIEKFPEIASAGQIDVLLIDDEFYELYSGRVNQLYIGEIDRSIKNSDDEIAQIKEFIKQDKEYLEETEDEIWEGLLRQDEELLAGWVKYRDYLVSLKGKVKEGDEPLDLERGLYDEERGQIIIPIPLNETTPQFVSTLSRQYLYAQSDDLPIFYKSALTDIYIEELFAEAEIYDGGLLHPESTLLARQIISGLDSERMRAIYISGDEKGLASSLDSRYGAGFYDESTDLLNLSIYPFNERSALERVLARYKIETENAK